MLRLLQQFRLRDQVQAQRFAAGAVVVLAGDLDQTAPAILPTVARCGITSVNGSRLATGSLSKVAVVVLSLAVCSLA